MNSSATCKVITILNFHNSKDFFNAKPKSKYYFADYSCCIHVLLSDKREERKERTVTGKGWIIKEGH
jgi:hypothetical protein